LNWKIWGQTNHANLTKQKLSAIWTPLESIADGLMTITVIKDPPKIIAKILWKTSHETKLQNNFRAVQLWQQKTHTVEALARKGTSLQEIDQILKGYMEKDYIEPVPKNEEMQGWYLPFFEVINRAKSTPVRLVYDAKTKFKGTSLNNQILDTPNRLNDITVVLTNMRKYRYTLAGDISEMFLQIHLDENDRQFHRIIHKEAHYQFKRVLFGNKSLPDLSQKTLETLCNSYPEFKEAKSTIIDSCYMDDFIESRNSEKEIVELASQLPTMLLKGGMRICKLYSNSQKALEKIPKDQQAQSVLLEDKASVFSDQKVLGLIYNVNQDCLAKQGITLNEKLAIFLVYFLH